MSTTYLGYVFDEEIFERRWGDEPDPVLLAMIQSGAVVQDAEIARLVSEGGDTYTIPFYNELNSDENDVNYDGATDITASEHSSDKQTGVVFGRAKAWFARDFVGDITQDDPMTNIVKKVARWWQKKDQARFLGITTALFGNADDEEFAEHSTNIATASATITEENLVNVSTINDAITKANGDNKGLYSMALMHSTVANRLETLQLLKYWTYTDANGIQRPMNIANINGLTVIIDDSVPIKASSSATGRMEYTTLLLGNGVMRTAPAPVDKPSEVDRDPAKNGGQDTLYTRVRKTFHPNGFTYKVPSSGYTHSPTDAQLFSAANWSRKFPAKSIPIARLITNG